MRRWVVRYWIWRNEWRYAAGRIGTFEYMAWDLVLHDELDRLR